ncbi:MAG: PASTA domain-containing protein [Mediterranea sp.]|jgi:hypothetical protein|nr:PASTA domain-containing protein [Mediterranea sp.]
MTIKEFFSWKANKRFWLNLVAMALVVVAALFGTMKGLDIYTRHGETVTVPDIKGMTVTQASQALLDNKLKAMVVDSSYIKSEPAGIILELKPGVGEKVKEGRTIYLTINTLNIPLKEVPDLADNSSLREAEMKVQAAGFKLDNVEFISGEKDWVYGVKYQGRLLAIGDKIPLGAGVTLMVGDGNYEAPDSDAIDSLRTEQPGDETGTEGQDDSWF